MTVRLTVTDSDGVSASTTREVVARRSQVAWVAAASANTNSRQHRVRVPGEVQEGDLLLLHLALNSDNRVDSPEGWDFVGAATGGGVSGGTWTRRATAEDAGSLVTVRADRVSKGDTTVVAYRGLGGRRATVLAHAGAVERRTTTEHTSAPVQVPAAGGWLVTYWASKASTQSTWDSVGGQARRTDSAGVGGGRITAVLTDSDGALPSGPAGELAGTTSARVARVLTFSTVVGLE